MGIDIAIKKKYRGFSLCINFISEENRIGILGASGSGKSMMLKCIAGIMTPDEGHIIVNGKTFFDSRQKINLSPQKRRTGYLFQNYALFPNMTVEQNIGAGLQGTTADKKSKVLRLLERFGLGELEHRMPHELSGGQQQRVALARMLAYEPDIIMLDEPFSALDGYLKEKMQHEMMSILKDYSGEVLLVSHSRDDIYRFCPMVLTIDNGQPLQMGTVQEIFMQPATYKVARLTGCNNISAVEKTGTCEIFVPGWGISLKTEVPVGDDIRYVGLRAHDLRGAEQAEENAYQMQLFDMVESPFEYKYHMKKLDFMSGEHIWWKTYKDLGPDCREEMFPRYICFPKEKLLLLKG